MKKLFLLLFVPLLLDASSFARLIDESGAELLDVQADDGTTEDFTSGSVMSEYQMYEAKVIECAERLDFSAIDVLTIAFFKPHGSLSRRDILRRVSNQLVPSDAIAQLELLGKLNVMLVEAQLQVGIPDDDLADARNLFSDHDLGSKIGSHWIGGISIDQKLLKKYPESFVYSALLHESTHYLCMDFLVNRIIKESLDRVTSQKWKQYCERRADLNSFDNMVCGKCLEEVYLVRKQLKFPSCYVQPQELRPLVEDAKDSGLMCVRHRILKDHSDPEISEVKDFEDYEEGLAL